MPYIQLSKLSLPSTASRAVVFPFLFQDGAADGPISYCFALLVSDRNRMAQAMLEALGFSKDLQNTSLPGGDTNDLWAFYRSKPAGTNDPMGPFGILSDTAAPDPHALATYLTWGTLAAVPGVTADIRKPDAITVHVAEMDPHALNPTAKVQLLSIDFDRSSSLKLRFAAASNTVDQTAVGFQLPVAGVVPRAKTGAAPNQQPVSFKFLVELVPQADSGGTWAGSILRFNTIDLVGGPDDRLPLDGAALVTSGGVASYEFLPMTRWAIPIGASGLFQVTFAVQSLRLRFSKTEVGLYLLNSATGSTIRFRVEFELPLIMSPVKGATRRRWRSSSRSSVPAGAGRRPCDGESRSKSGRNGTPSPTKSFRFRPPTQTAGRSITTSSIKIGRSISSIDHKEWRWADCSFLSRNS